MVDRLDTVVQEEVAFRELSVPADEGQLSRVRDFVTEVCEDAGFTSRETNNTKLAVDEACTNIIKHAYDKHEGDIELRAEITSGNVDIHITDSGKRFDFASIRDPDLDQYVETGKKGGLGVFLINRLMDRVEYRAGEDGNELFLSKRSHAAIAGTGASRISWRGSLRYKFTLRASLGFLVLIAAMWGYIFARQTTTLGEQQTTQWLEKRRIAESLANKSKELLLNPQAYSVEQTTLTAFVSQMLDGNRDLAYILVVDRDGSILSSGNVDDIFTDFSPPAGDVLQEDNGIVWTQTSVDDELVRDIALDVSVRNADNDTALTVGSVHLGIYEEMLRREIRDPRAITALIVFVIFVIGIFLIAGLVKVFVKPIQVLTDGVRAIGQGSLDGKISVEGPAEIGAIAAVFNEISEKFKKAQESVLEQEKLQKEIEVAKQIQQALLPKKHPAVSGYDIAPYYQAAKEVGGDYYDFVMVDDDTLGVVVADVSGKGVPGSLVMTMIRTALRMEARGNKNASDVMSKMNDFVTDDMKKGMFVTMFYVILDSKNRIISYASAGHNPMILYRADTQDIFFLNPKGFPVGIALPDESLFRRSISLEKIKLKKDDMLLIYTDGVTEAMNERREQYGEDRLVDLVKENGHLPPHEFIDIMEKDVKTFTGGFAQNDDITVVAVKEKLAADDVLFGIRKKLIDMVDVAGMTVKEACAKMKVSPATYYRYRKRMQQMGERGLKNKVLREDLDLKRVSIQERKELIRIIRDHPEYGAKRIEQVYNQLKGMPRPMTEKMVYEELRRLNLNTKELRLDYLRRHRLLDEEPVATPSKTSKELVEELITEVAREAAEPEPEPQEVDGQATVDVTSFVDDDIVTPRSETAVPDDDDDDPIGGVRIEQTETNGAAILKVDGHLDSISSTALEKRLQRASHDHSKIIVDLSKVSYISSGGWGVMVGRVEQLQKRDGDIVVVGMASEVYDVYELLGFNALMKSFNTTDEALTYLAKPTDERRPKEEPVITEEVREVAPTQPTVAAEPDLSDAAGEWESLQIEATTVGDKGDVAVISLKGIIDTISAERLRNAIDRVIKSGISKIVVDLSLIEYVSSGGWGTFTERLRELRRLGGDIKLFGMDPDVYYIFTMLGFNIVLSSFNILSEAIEDFSRSTGDKASVHPEQRSVDADSDPDVSTSGAPTSNTLDEDALVTSTSRVEWTQIDGNLVARIRGMIESSSVEDIDTEIQDKLGHRPPAVAFDLSGVDYVSSTGWGIFAKYYQTVSQWDGRLALCAMNSELHDIFVCLEFHSFIPSFPSIEDAVSWFRGPSESTGIVKRNMDVDSVLPDVEKPGTDDATDLGDLIDTDPDEFEERQIDDWPDDTPENAPTAPEPETEETGSESHLDRPADTDHFADLDSVPTDVSVDRTDKEDNVGEDSKLRKLGWEKYGERLKGRSRPKESKDDGDGDES